MIDIIPIRDDVDYMRRILWLLAHQRKRDKDGQCICTLEAFALAPQDAATSIFKDEKTGNLIIEPDGECPFSEPRDLPEIYLGEPWPIPQR